MILSAVGDQRGQPIAFYYDPFKARAHFATFSDMLSAFTGHYTAFLVAYEVDGSGSLVEIAELGRK